MPDVGETFDFDQNRMPQDNLIFEDRDARAPQADASVDQWTLYQDEYGRSFMGQPGEQPLSGYDENIPGPSRRVHQDFDRERHAHVGALRGAAPELVADRQPGRTATHYGLADVRESSQYGLPPPPVDNRQQTRSAPSSHCSVPASLPNGSQGQPKTRAQKLSASQKGKQRAQEPRIGPHSSHPTQPAHQGGQEARFALNTQQNMTPAVSYTQQHHEQVWSAPPGNAAIRNGGGLQQQGLYQIQRQPRPDVRNSRSQGFQSTKVRQGTGETFQGPIAPTQASSMSGKVNINGKRANPASGTEEESLHAAKRQRSQPAATSAPQGPHQNWRSSNPPSIIHVDDNPRHYLRSDDVYPSTAPRLSSADGSQHLMPNAVTNNQANHGIAPSTTRKKRQLEGTEDSDKENLKPRRKKKARSGPAASLHRPDMSQASGERIFLQQAVPSAGPIDTTASGHSEDPYGHGANRLGPNDRNIAPNRGPQQPSIPQSRSDTYYNTDIGIQKAMERSLVPVSANTPLYTMIDGRLWWCVSSSDLTNSQVMVPLARNDVEQLFHAALSQFDDRPATRTRYEGYTQPETAQQSTVNGANVIIEGENYSHTASAEDGLAAAEGSQIGLSKYPTHPPKSMPAIDIFEDPEQEKMYEEIQTSGNLGSFVSGLDFLEERDLRVASEHVANDSGEGTLRDYAATASLEPSAGSYDAQSMVNTSNEQPGETLGAAASSPSIFFGNSNPQVAEQRPVGVSAPTAENPMSMPPSAVFSAKKNIEESADHTGKQDTNYSDQSRNLILKQLL